MEHYNQQSGEDTPNGVIPVDREEDAETTPCQPQRKRQRTENPISRASIAYPRKRATAACRLCRARKIKCNNARPACGSCLTSKAPCVYEDSQDYSA